MDTALLCLSSIVVLFALGYVTATLNNIEKTLNNIEKILNRLLSKND